MLAILGFVVPAFDGIGGDLAVDEGEGPRAVVDFHVAAESDPPAGHPVPGRLGAELDRAVDGTGNGMPWSSPASARAWWRSVPYR